MCDSAEGPDGASFNAVKRRCKAWNRALDDAKAKNLDASKARGAAKKAYQRAMPFLCGEDNILGFLAAVAEGYLIGAFYDFEVNKLVYIAQVALTGLPRQSRPAAVRPEIRNRPQPIRRPQWTRKLQPRIRTLARQSLPIKTLPSPSRLAQSSNIP